MELFNEIIKISFGVTLVLLMVLLIFFMALILIDFIKNKK